MRRLINHQNSQISGKWWREFGSIPSVYRFVTFVIAAALTPFIILSRYWVVSSFILLPAVGVYSLLEAIYRFHWYQRRIQKYVILGLDVSICFSLILLTGGLYSPFLLYSLTPVLTVGLLLDRKTTFAIAMFSGACVFGSHLWNPFFFTRLGPRELGIFLIYMLALSWGAILPYLININLRQQLKLEDTISERQRLSHEIHDEVAQTVTAVRWQAEFVHSRLLGMGIDLPEVSQLVKLTERAQQDTRDCLVLLHSYTGDGSFVPRLRDYVEYFKQRSNIDFQFAVETRELHLERLVELQLLRICQEALINVIKHADAHTVQIKVQSLDGHLAVSIADDGCGFDAIAYYHNPTNGESLGLAVMQERTESIGGRLQVLSMPGQGTEIKVEIPFASNGGRLWLKR